MKFLIAGLGSIGRRHLRNLLALGQDDILLYRTGRSTLPDDELARFPFEADLQAALARRPDAVIVANPTGLHLDVAIPAARAGCHLLLEKPVSHSMERTDELQEALRLGGGKALVAFQFRFHPGLRKVAELLAAEAIGRPLTFRAVYSEYLPGFHPWEDYRQSYSARRDLGGGVVLTLCHPLDYLRWLLGEARCLSAFAGQLSDLELDVEDTAEAIIEMESGVIGSVRLDYNGQPPEHTLEIAGTQGKLRWDGASGSAALFQAQNPSSGAGGKDWEVLPVPPVQIDGPAGLARPFERNDLFLAEMRHFLSVVRGKVDPICPLEDGLQSLRLALAVLQSARLGQKIHL